MKGLIIKDILNLKKQAKIMLFFILFYGVMSFATKDSNMATFILVLMLSMMVITSFAYDDVAKWDKYALSMPITRKEAVASKYVLMVISNIFGAVLSILMSLVTGTLLKTLNVKDMLLFTGSAVGVSIIFISIIMPLIYKFGVEKARLMVFIVVAIPMLIGFLVANSGMNPPSDDVVKGLIYASPIFAILIVAISYMISCKIYMNKEM